MAEKVLITGGLGFIGLSLAQTLVGRGMTVRLMDNLSPQIHGIVPAVFRGRVPQPDLGDLAEDRVEVMRGDVCNRRDWVLALRDVASVVHLAAETGTGQSMYRIGDYARTNVLGTSLLLDVLANDRHEVKKLVLAPPARFTGRAPINAPAAGLSILRCAALAALRRASGILSALTVAAPFARQPHQKARRPVPHRSTPPPSWPRKIWSGSLVMHSAFPA